MGGQRTPGARSGGAFGARRAYAGAMNPSRDSRPGIRAIFLDIAASCERLDAPVYADLARCVAEWSDVEPLRSLLAPYAEARWLDGERADIEDFGGKHRTAMAVDIDDSPVFLGKSAWEINYVAEKYPKVRFLRTRERS